MSQDVVLVGAGPTGLLLAGDLAAAGRRGDRAGATADSESNLTRAFGVHARTLEHLDARGLADELIARGRPRRAAAAPSTASGSTSRRCRPASPSC